MGLNGENQLEAVNLRCQKGLLWDSEQNVFMGGWEVKPVQKRAC